MPQSACVESFCLTLPGDFRQGVRDAEPVQALETRITGALGDCDRLLRWAVTCVRADGFEVEGAYLKAGR